jgi:hypothetical protein
MAWSCGDCGFEMIAPVDITLCIHREVDFRIFDIREP